MLQRSILIKVSVLAVISFGRCQDFHSEADEPSPYEDSSADDYSHYSGAPLQAKQAIAPVEFSDFYVDSGSFDIEASNKQEVKQKPQAVHQGGVANPRGLRAAISEYDLNGFGEYIHTDGKQEASNVQASYRPGPNYISHRVPAPSDFQAEATEVKDVYVEAPAASNLQEDKAFTSEDLLNKEAVKLDGSPYDFKSSAIVNLPTFDSSFANKEAISSGKLSYAPAALDYSFNDYEFHPLSASSSLSSGYIPSEFFSFSPKSDVYEHSASEKQPKKIAASNCVEVHKEIDKQPMKCSVCKDASGAQSEQCSYSGQPAAYYKQKSYKSNSPEPARHKRDQKKANEDPYEYIKSRNSYSSIPEEFSYSYYNPKEEESNQKDKYTYEFDPKEYSFGDDKSYSELQAEKLMKEGHNCKQSLKDGMTCTVCTDPKSGGNFEQCSYAVEPKEQKYAYVKESKFDGNGNPIKEEKQPNANEPAPQPVAENADKAPAASNPEALINEKQKELERNGRGENFDSKADGQKSASENVEEKTSAENDDDDEESNDSKEKQENNDKDDEYYHFKYFPEVYKPDQQQKVEKKIKPVDLPDPESYFQTDESKKDVEKVFAEFVKKDRSNCKQVSKKGMTCYLCLDQKGIQNEECMYVSESRPKSTLMAYHEMQHVKKPEENKQEQPAAAANAEAASNQIQTKAQQPAAAKAAPEMKAAASSLVETVVKYVPAATNTNPVKRSIFRKSKTPKKYRDPAAAASEKEETDADDEDDDEEEESEEAGDKKEKLDSNEKDDAETEEKQKLQKDSTDVEPQFDIHDEEGLYKDETKPVYSEALGFSLPRFMLEKSEHEESYDEFVKAGRK